MTPARWSLWINWALVVLALGSSALVIATSKSVTSAERESRSKHLLTAFRVDDVTRVSLQRDDERWVVERTPAEERTRGAARFRLVEPLQGDAEEATLDQLLRAAQFATWIRRVEPGSVDRVRFGLDQPSSVLGIEMGELRYRIRVGQPAPAPEGAHYVELSGEGAPNKGVYVVSESTAKDLSPNPQDFRIRQLIPYSGDKLQRIMVRRSGKNLALVRHGRSGFRFDRLLGGVRLSEYAVDRLLLGFSRTQAQRFIDVEAARALQAAAADDLLRLELVPTSERSERATIVIGGACPGEDDWVIALREHPRPSAACIVDNTSLDELFDKPEWLADHALFSASLDEVERVSITDGERELLLARVGNGFEMRAPERGAVEAQAAERRLQDMLDTRGEIVTSREPASSFGLSEPSRVVTVDKASSDPQGDQEVVELGIPQQDVVYARRQADGAILRLAPSALRPFATDTLLLRARSVLELEPGGVRRLSVEQIDQHSSTLWQIAQPERGKFQLLSPESYQLDTGLAVAWVDSVRQLGVERWVATSDDGSFGFGTPRLRVEVEDEQGASTRLLVGGRAPGGYYARVGDEPAVGIVDTRLVETLSTLPIDRDGFSFDPATLESLTLRHRNGTLELKRLGDEVLQVSGQPVMSTSDVEALLDALSLVRPEAAIARGADAARYDFSQPLLDVQMTIAAGNERRIRHYQLGAGDFYRDMAVYSARQHGQPVVFAVPRGLVQRVLDEL